MTPTDDLTPILKKLRLSGTLHTLELRSRQAIEDQLPYPEFLYRLLSDEVERREAKQLDLRTRRAQFEAMKTLEDFEFSFNPKIPKAKIIDLATCQFVTRKSRCYSSAPAGLVNRTWLRPLVTAPVVWATAFCI
jgi:DNA replication protein DnaC